jgi:riboflavin synthase alpha subunit
MNTPISTALSRNKINLEFDVIGKYVSKPYAK